MHSGSAILQGATKESYSYCADQLIRGRTTVGSPGNSNAPAPSDFWFRFLICACKPILPRGPQNPCTSCHVALVPSIHLMQAAWYLVFTFELPHTRTTRYGMKLIITGAHRRQLKVSLCDRINILNKDASEFPLAKQVFRTASVILDLVKVCCHPRSRVHSGL